MNSFPVVIVTPKGKMFEGAARSLIAPGTEGSFGILAHHAPLVAALKKGILELTTPHDQKYYVMSSGVVEMNVNGELTILADSVSEATTKEVALQQLKSLDDETIQIMQ